VHAGAIEGRLLGVGATLTGAKRSRAIRSLRSRTESNVSREWSAKRGRCVNDPTLSQSYIMKLSVSRKAIQRIFTGN
jgi:hypothetical protein